MPEEAGLAALDEAEALLAQGRQTDARARIRTALDYFANAKLPARTATALAYLRETADAITPPRVRAVRQYLARRPQHAFAPPL